MHPLRIPIIISKLSSYIYKSFFQLSKFIESRFQRGKLSTLSYHLHIYHTLHRNDSLDGIRDLDIRIYETSKTYNPRYKNIQRVHKCRPQRGLYLHSNLSQCFSYFTYAIFILLLGIIKKLMKLLLN